MKLEDVQGPSHLVVVYYESLKRGIYTSHIHSVVCGTGTPKDRDEVNKLK